MEQGRPCHDVSGSPRDAACHGMACRRQVAAVLDDVATGASHCRILQRVKLNSQVALVTGV